MFWKKTAKYLFCQFHGNSFIYLFIALLSFFYNRVGIDFKGRIITIIQSLVSETSFSCKSFSESKISHFLLQLFLIHLLQLLKSLILKIDVRIIEKVVQPMGFPAGVVVQNPSANVGDIRESDLIPGSKSPWRRAWQAPPIFLPEGSHEQRRLAGYSPQGRRVRHDWSGVAHSHIQSMSLTPFF